MYISPLTKLALFPEAAGDSDFPPGLRVERIGGTSTCWMPFFAWMLALILAAAAAVKSVNLILCCEKIAFDSITYLQQPLLHQDLSSRFLGRGYWSSLTTGFCYGVGRPLRVVVIESVCRISKFALARVLSDRSASALRCVVPYHPS